MAGDIKLTRLLLGMGLREFSMHPAQLLAVQQDVLNSDLTVITPQTKKLDRTFEPFSLHESVDHLRRVANTATGVRVISTEH